MKRFFYAVLAAAATLSFAACKEEVDNTTPEPLGDKVVAFTLQKTDTRSATGTSDAYRGEKLPMGVIDGQAIFLEETITSLDDVPSVTPETRGTPLYSENFLTISGGSFKGLAFPAADMTDKQASAASWPEGDFEYTPRNQWERQYEWDPWFEQDALLVYAKMLTEYTGTSYSGPIGVIPTSYQYSYNATAGQTMSFSYRSPLTAEDQQDILFAARTVTSKEAKKQVPMIFYHALTGVKFATAHLNDGNVKTYIKSVSFSGIYGYGKCTITSTAENGGYSDDPAVHSSASAVSWTTSYNGVNSATAVYSQDFPEDPVTYAADGRFTNNGSYPSSFSQAGNKNNLNDGDATMTFWFVPQTLTDATKITIVFEIEVDGNRKEYTRVVKGTDLNNIEWKAGQLRTYTLKANEVDVKIEDEVHGFVKDNVVITNTGNVNAYIRAHIVANWWGKTIAGDDGLALGYIGDDEAPNDPIEYVTAWKMVGTTGDNYGGVFTGLPGTDWVYGNDGFFYYKNAVAPGEATGSPLFTKYELVTTEHPVPIIWYLSGTSGLKKFTQVRLVMDLPVQAIEAKAEYADYKAAWAAAGVTLE